MHWKYFYRLQRRGSLLKIVLYRYSTFMSIDWMHQKSFTCPPSTTTTICFFPSLLLLHQTVPTMIDDGLIFHITWLIYSAEEHCQFSVYHSHAYVNQWRGNCWKQCRLKISAKDWIIIMTNYYVFGNGNGFLMNSVQVNHPPRLTVVWWLGSKSWVAAACSR